MPLRCGTKPAKIRGLSKPYPRAIFCATNAVACRLAVNSEHLADTTIRGFVCHENLPFGGENVSA